MVCDKTGLSKLLPFLRGLQWKLYSAWSGGFHCVGGWVGTRTSQLWDPLSSSSYLFNFGIHKSTKSFSRWFLGSSGINTGLIQSQPWKSAPGPRISRTTQSDFRELWERSTSFYKSLINSPPPSESGRDLLIENIDFYCLPFFLSESSDYGGLSPKSSLHPTGWLVAGEGGGLSLLPPPIPTLDPPASCSLPLSPLEPNCWEAANRLLFSIVPRMGGCLGRRTVLKGRKTLKMLRDNP